jgi:trimeric autotransporter adhesin
MRVSHTVFFAASWLAVVAALLVPVDARQASVAAGCRVIGRAVSAATALPGVAVIAGVDAGVTAATSTDPDGSFTLSLPPGTYRLTAELPGFVRIERSLSIEGPVCEQRLELQMALTPPLGVNPAGGRAANPPARGRGTGAGAARFQPLSVAAQPAADAVLEADAPTEAAEAARTLLPPGFSAGDATDTLAVNGNAASLDRGMLNDRLEAIGRGEFDPAALALNGGFGPEGAGGPGGARFGGPEGGGFAGREGPPGAGGGGPRGGGPGRGGFGIGGRGGRQNLYSATANYTFGGSALDAAPYQLREGPSLTNPGYTRQNFGLTVGGPVKIPGIYDGTRRTNFNLNYGANRGSTLFDQYATVPTDAMRAGDFSATSVTLIDPLTALPFAGNQIPLDRISPSARALLAYIPAANVPGTARNFHETTTVQSTSDNISGRLTHSFTQPRAGGGGRGGGFGGRGGPPGGGRQNQTGTSVTLNAQVQYRRTVNDQVNVFPTLGGRTKGSSITLPVSLNIQHKRAVHNLTLTFSRTSSNSLNHYAFTKDVAGTAGITGVSTDPFDWGVPALSFSSVSNLRDLAPSSRSDERWQAGYAWTRPYTKHTLRLGGDARLDRSASETDANAAGAFVFSGLYSSGGSQVTRTGGADFADFLLGLPQQATIQYGPGNIVLRGRSFSAYVQDEWRRRSNLTFNMGARYELVMPFTEANGHMVNLDAAPGFTAVAPVVSGGTGPFTGSYPSGLLLPDANNIAPRVGVAWRIARGTILRGGYGVSYNAGSYSTIARQLAVQPPFAVASTAIGTFIDPLTLADPAAVATPNETTNSYGVEKDYVLGLVQTWNADFSRQLNQAWLVGANYTETRESGMDVVRAPTHGHDGLRIADVQPFLWQTSDGSSVLHAAAFRLQRRLVKGIGGGISYTLARSRDDASSIGGGGTVVAQDDQNLPAEWGLSSFDRRHQLSGNLNLELPFGPNKPWLADGGVLAAMFRNWRATVNVTLQSGTPFTPRVLSAASDVARGTNGTLRADYSGERIGLSDPTIDRFFNTTAFTVPETGTFGDASRNIIIGPGSKQLNAQLSRDIPLSGSRTISIQLNAANLLNLVNYQAIDTVVNSPTFGQITSVRPMRSVQLNVRFRY